MSLLADRRFDALLTEVDELRSGIRHDTEQAWPSHAALVEDAVQIAFADLPRTRHAIEKRSRAEGRRPQLSDLEAVWRKATHRRMTDAVRRAEGRAQDGPVDVRPYGDNLAEVLAEQDVRPSGESNVWRQWFQEVLLTLEDRVDRRFAQIRLLDMNRVSSDREEVVVSMEEARRELGWSQREWNHRGKRVRDQIAEAVQRIGTPAWCEEHFQEIGPWLSAQLDPHMQQRVALHVEGCDRCSGAAARMQGELREAAQRVFDPASAISLGGGVGLFGWLQAKLGIGAGASAVAGSSTAGGVGGSALGGGAIGGTLVAKACAGVAAVGCVAAVGGEIVKETTSKSSKPAAVARASARTKRPATINASTRLGVIPAPAAATTSTAKASAPAPRRSAVAPAARTKPRVTTAQRAKAQAKREASRAQKALSPLGSTPTANSTSSSPSAVQANRALGGIQTAAPATTPSAPSSLSQGDQSSSPPPSTAATANAAAEAFGP